jgi:hypothetical protein
MRQKNYDPLHPVYEMSTRSHPNKLRLNFLIENPVCVGAGASKTRTYALEPAS